MDLIGRIYECSLRSELWPETLHTLANAIAARGGVLFTSRERVLKWTTSPALDLIFERYFREGWLARCTRKTCLLSQTAPGFLTERDLGSLSEIDENPTYRNFLRPLGLGWSAGTAIRLPTGDDLVFSFERDYTRGPLDDVDVDLLNGLLPHLSRSAFIAARLRLERARGSADTLTALQIAAATLDASGHVLAANVFAAETSGYAQLTEGARLQLHDGRAQSMLADALGYASGEIDDASLSFPVRDGEGLPQAVLHLLPIRRSARDIFEKSVALAVFAPVAHPKIISIDLIRSLFDLTQAEARVARCLANGRAPKQIATDLSIAVDTVRYHLKSIYSKVGCRRQADLVRLLTQVAPRERTHGP